MTSHLLVLEPTRTLRSVYERVCEERRLSMRIASGVAQALLSITKAKPLAVVASLEQEGLPTASLIAALRHSPHHRAIPLAVATSSDSAEKRLSSARPDMLLKKRNLLRDLGVFLDSLGFTRSVDSTSGRLGGSILLVDDVAVNRKLFGGVLHVAGADVVVAESAVEALEIVISRNFDLVLLDIEMPYFDGYQASTCMRELGVTAPILALTGTEPDSVRGAFDGVLLKGSGVHGLVGGCRRYLPTRRSA